MTKYRSRDGQPMELLEWAKAFEEYEIRQVAIDYVGPYMISTIWLGIDEPTLARGLFESVAFLNGERVEERFSDTEEEARTEHAEVLANWTAAVNG